MTRILCIGDQHLDTADAKMIELFILEVKRVITEKKPDIVICMGDMLHYHNKIYIQTLNKAYEFVEMISNMVKTYILVGNHDMIGPACFLDEKSHWLNGIKKWTNVVIVDKVVVDIINGKKLVFLPYVQVKRFEEALNTIGDDWKDASCIFAHQEFRGCKMGCIVSDEGDEWSLDYPNIISGHIHGRQQPQPNIFYTGSAIQTSFGEHHDKTISLISFDNTTESDDKLGDNIFINNIELNLPKKKVVYKTVDEVEKWVVPKQKNRLDAYKVCIKGEPSDFKSFKKSKKYKEIVKENITITFKHVQTNIITEEDLHQKLERKDKYSFEQILMDLLNKEKYSEKLKTLYKRIV